MAQTPGRVTLQGRKANISLELTLRSARATVTTDTPSEEGGARGLGTKPRPDPPASEKERAEMVSI